MYSIWAGFVSLTLYFLTSFPTLYYVSSFNSNVYKQGEPEEEEEGGSNAAGESKESSSDSEEEESEEEDAEELRELMSDEEGDLHDEEGNVIPRPANTLPNRLASTYFSTSFSWLCYVTFLTLLTFFDSTNVL